MHCVGHTKQKPNVTAFWWVGMAQTSLHQTACAGVHLTRMHYRHAGAPQADGCVCFSLWCQHVTASRPSDPCILSVHFTETSKQCCTCTSRWTLGCEYSPRRAANELCCPRRTEHAQQQAHLSSIEQTQLFERQASRAIREKREAFQQP